MVYVSSKNVDLVLCCLGKLVRLPNTAIFGCIVIS